LLPADLWDRAPVDDSIAVMDGATLGGLTRLPPGIRIWLDDPNPIFRMGLAASLRDSGFVVVGESTAFVPPPDLHGVDVLVFDLGEHDSLGTRLSRRQLRSTRLVGLVPGGDIDWATRSQCTVLVRSELTPEGFRDCVASLAAEASAPAGSAGQPGPFRAAWADAGSRLRRTMRRRGTLVAVVVALAAGAFGPTGKAEGMTDPHAGAVVTVPAAVETTPVDSDGDAAGDAAVWVNPTDPSASLVFGTDKRGALESYDLQGRRVQRLARPAGTVKDVDVRSGFPLAGRTVTLVGTGGRAVSFFRLDAAARQLHEVGAHTFAGAQTGAFCLYRSGVTGRFYAFVTKPDHDITQYELFDQGGFIDAREVRSWPLGSAAAGCVTDDETGRLFVSQPSGVWRYNAEPDRSPVGRTQVDRVGGDGHLTGSVGGLALVTQPGRRGFLVASSRGDSTFAIYRRGRDNAWLGQRQVVGGPAADGCTDTNGIEAVAANLGSGFPAGIFVCQDSINTPPGPSGHQNFKYVRLENVIDASSLPT
jgi:myo-inositol-hexaphosphate 3-phosphohydrolase